MDVDNTGSGLNGHVRAKRSDLGVRRETDYRPLQHSFPAQFVGNVGLRYRRGFLLRAGKRSGKQNDCECSTTHTQPYVEFHYPSPRSRDFDEPLRITSPRVARGPTHMFHWLDGYYTPNVSRAGAFCSNRQHFFFARAARKLPPRNQTPFATESFALCIKSRRIFKCAFILLCQFPHLNFRVPRINSSI